MMENIVLRSTLKVGIVTVSDRAFRGEYADRSGPAIGTYLQETVTSPIELHVRLVNDQQWRIMDALCELVDQVGCHFVLTTGGTGPAPRDVTPEATMAVCSRLLPGFGEEMRRVSMQKVPTAILSRQVAGVRGQAFILNLPGSPKAIAECLDAIFPAVPDCLEHVGGPRIDIAPDKFAVYRPHDPPTA
jgi:molybdopterin adenylyltransferase